MMIVMRRLSVRAASPWLLAALLTVALAACAPAAASDIPTAGGSEEAAPANANPAPPVDPEDAGMLYAQCVRDNGYPDFPDPGPDGRFALGGHGAGAHDRNDPRLRAAQEACSDLRPAGLDHQDTGDPDYVEQMLALAQCMRDNGVPDFPDPGPDGRIVLGHGAGGYGDPKVSAAMETCSQNLPGGGGH